MHIAIHFKRFCDNILPVKLLVDYAGADSKTIKSDCQVEKCCTVPDLNTFRHIKHAQKLLAEIKRISLALLIHKIRIRLQLVKRDFVLMRKRMIFADKNMR